VNQIRYEDGDGHHLFSSQPAALNKVHFPFSLALDRVSMVSLIQLVDNFVENALYHLLNMKSDTIPVEK
jgi:hypothetical protein